MISSRIAQSSLVVCHTLCVASSGQRRGERARRPVAGRVANAGGQRALRCAASGSRCSSCSLSRRVRQSGTRAQRRSTAQADASTQEVAGCADSERRKAQHSRGRAQRSSATERQPKLCLAPARSITAIQPHKQAQKIQHNLTNILHQSVCKWNFALLRESCFWGELSRKIQRN